jgi:hypothetical protein
VLRSVLIEDPIKLDGLCRIAIRIRATDQLNGIIDTFNCVVTSILPDWDAATSTWIERPTTNPASIFRNVLQGTANAQPLADARLDLASIEAWHDDCAAAGRGYNFIVEQRTTVDELLRQIVAIGRASRGSVDGRWGIVRDVPQTVPIQHFTPRNSRSFSLTKIFRDLPHAIKARFINPEAGWEIDERIVLADGYAFDYGDGRGPRDAFDVAAPTLPLATKFEAIQFFGVTDADQAWKEARYHIAVATLRPEVYNFETDVEHIVCTRGDLIQVAHDVALFGVGSGRLKDVTVVDDAITAVALDEPMLMDTAHRYSLRVRRSDGQTLLAEIVPNPGLWPTLTLLTPVPQTDPPVAAGDIFMFGTIGEESIPAIVTRIEMLQDIGARLMCVDAAPGIHLADTGAIPPHQSHITRPPDLSTLALLPPNIVDVRSDESALVVHPDGSFEARIIVFLHWQSGVGRMAEFVEARYRRSDDPESAWLQARALSTGDAAQIIIAPVEEGVTYDIMARGISPASNLATNWSTVVSHTVVGKSAPPPDVLTLRLESDTLKWAYPRPPVDLAGFELRRHYGAREVWEDAQPIHAGILTDNSFPLAILDYSIVTYLIKAVDVAGNYSTNAAALVVNLGDIITDNLIFTRDLGADGFPGTITNGTVSGGALVANDSGELFYPDADDYLFWGASATAPFWNAVNYQRMTYLFGVLPDADQVPAALLLDLAVTAQAYSVEYRTAGTRIFWGTDDAAVFWQAGLGEVIGIYGLGGVFAAWGGVGEDPFFWGPSEGGDEFLPWMGRLDNIKRQMYEFRIITAPGASQGVIAGCAVLIDVPDIHELMHDVVIAAGGTRLPITDLYRAIDNIRLTLHSSGTAVTAKILDRGSGGPPLTGGPLIACYNPANVSVAGLIDAEVVGY